MNSNNLVAMDFLVFVRYYSPGPQPGSLSSENISLVPIASNLYKWREHKQMIK